MGESELTVQGVAATVKHEQSEDILSKISGCGCGASREIGLIFLDRKKIAAPEHRHLFVLGTSGEGRTFVTHTGICKVLRQTQKQIDSHQLNSEDVK